MSQHIHVSCLTLQSSQKGDDVFVFGKQDTKKDASYKTKKDFFSKNKDAKKKEKKQSSKQKVKANSHSYDSKYENEKDETDKVDNTEKQGLRTRKGQSVAYTFQVQHS